ncbi:carbohydrate ABC transporter permease [Rhodococcus sp. 06-156-3C]|uniref:carbohydrate ABC transporter permease n=1 Tax=Nocardiaceae TaxID=85025 RepID=UPI0005230397|nr:MULTISPECIES: carbohydrate ABC transporter permease [Rhodococcus]OZD15209.1 carbohydrate ABC transporter permease [Rhodococcus sp. 06-156-4C]OZD19703.1 carbohydrate ABC transporter permease [Rhodococcus sp. 06-156-4a]OZD22986.1 carbohydrate ABC transporter permease [Rhodococcus sp. 06-156-3C]OZD25721.1 carbohydrate ABC transporter permease [Rhodococcus sp. 06-156-3b]OZD37928.1 carbohydrate ABC transporter permease [Rhodococcus sp. 06-156-3]
MVATLEKTGVGADQEIRPRRRTLVLDVITYAVLVVSSLLVLGPFLLSTMTSLKSSKQFAAEPATSFPSPLTADSYVGLIQGNYGFGRSILVTAVVSLVIVVGQTVFSVFAAYAFARLEFPGRDFLFWAYLSTLMVPGVVTMIPLYLLLSESGLRNTFWALVLPFVFGSPYAIFLLRQHFLSLPTDLISAARLDGAGHLRILWHVVVPLSKPVVSTLAVITAVTHWNSFLWPLIITSGGRWQVITVATANLQTQFNGNWTLVMTATTIAIVPLLALFVAFHKTIVSSLTIKGFN